MRIRQRALAGLLVALPALPAQAAFDWWLVHSAGERPARTLVFADADSVKVPLDRPSDQTTQLRVNAEVVHEAVGSPDSAKYTFDVDCANGTLREAIVSTLYRDGRVETTPPDHPTRQSFAAPKAAWQYQTMVFACAPELRTQARGMHHFGTQEIHPSAIAWKLWPDGKEPAFTSTRPLAEIKAENDAALARMQALNQQQLSKFEGLLDHEDEVAQRREARMARWPKRGLKRAMHQDLLEPYVGMPEQALLERFGRPFKTLERPDSRLLYFAFGHDVVISGHRGVLGYGETAREQWRCYVTYEVKAGKAIDYVVSGNYCIEALGS